MNENRIADDLAIMQHTFRIMYAILGASTVLIIILVGAKALVFLSWCEIQNQSVVNKLTNCNDTDHSICHAPPRFYG